MPGGDKAPLIWINGFPGVGKLTIAKELVKIMGAEHSILIDNHQLIDPVAARLPRDHQDYYQARQAERNKAFARWVVNEAEAERTIVFTDCQVDNALGRSVASEFQAAAASSGRRFVPICLGCDEAENLSRATSLERVDSGTTKLVDLESLQRILANYDILTLGTPSEFSLNVTTMLPVDAAQKLYEHIKATSGEAVFNDL